MDAMATLHEQEFFLPLADSFTESHAQSTKTCQRCITSFPCPDEGFGEDDLGAPPMR